MACGAFSFARREGGGVAGRAWGILYILGPLRKFCVSDIRQNQEYHIIHVHDCGLFPLSTAFPGGWDGMRALCGVNAVPASRES